MFKQGGESFAGAMQLAAHRPDGLLGQSGNLFVAQFFVGHEQEQQAVFVGNGVQSLLDALVEFLGFEDVQRRVGFGGGVFPDGFVGIAEDVAVVPGLAKGLREPSSSLSP